MIGPEFPADDQMLIDLAAGAIFATEQSEFEKYTDMLVDELAIREAAAGKGGAISGHAPDCELVVQPNVAPRRGWMCDCRGRSAEKSDKVKP